MNNGQTALINAIEAKSLDVVKILFDAGANCNIQDNDDKCTKMG